jgi:hypothetical protein
MYQQYQPVEDQFVEATLRDLGLGNLPFLNPQDYPDLALTAGELAGLGMSRMARSRVEIVRRIREAQQARAAALLAPGPEVQRGGLALGGPGGWPRGGPVQLWNPPAGAAGWAPQNFGPPPGMQHDVGVPLAHNPNWGDEDGMLVFLQNRSDGDEKAARSSLARRMADQTALGSLVRGVTLLPSTALGRVRQIWKGGAEPYTRLV